MSQGVLAFKYEEEGADSGMTGLGGLPLYLDLAQVMELSKAVDEHVRGREGSQGWTDSQMVMAIVLLNLAGGDCVDDLERLQGDEGFCRALLRLELKHLGRRKRRELERRFRKERSRSVPSPSAARRYLKNFHDEEQEKLREIVEEKAFIPAANEYLRGFAKVNTDLLASVQKAQPEETATLDTDATLIETGKEQALFCYKGFKAYQPFNVWWAEQELIVHTEFRDGNVPAGYQQLRVLQEALEMLPAGVEHVRLRSDTAGYQHDLLRYCEEGKNERFGRIEFAVGADVTPEFKKAVAEVAEDDWQAIYRYTKDGKREETGREWADVCFVPDAISHSKNGPTYKYHATREFLDVQVLPGPGLQQQTLPFPTMELETKRYKIFGTVSNMEWDGDDIIDWLCERCGKSEEAHAVMKQDLAGGKMPSGDFGVNAAWWWMMILALNLNSAMKRLVLGEGWVSKRMKAIRFHLINLPGRVLTRARQLVIRLTKGSPMAAFLVEFRARIARLLPVPSG